MCILNSQEDRKSLEAMQGRAFMWRNRCKVLQRLDLNGLRAGHSHCASHMNSLILLAILKFWEFLVCGIFGRYRSRIADPVVLRKIEGHFQGRHIGLMTWITA